MALSLIFSIAGICYHFLSICDLNIVGEYKSDVDKVINEAISRIEDECNYPKQGLADFRKAKDKMTSVVV